tara:strand:- start:80 stop:1246 length:1167 start_codon:yes stop_codon:yes gene_type:complete
MSRNPQFNVNNEHQLIRRQNTYVLNRKLLTIHSEDRDITKWPNSNHFEVTIPEDLINVQSMRLIEIQIPGNHYVFSNNNQNTKMEFYVIPTSPGIPVSYYLPLALQVDVPFTITIQEGSYTGQQMALEIQNLMNLAVTTLLQATIPGAIYDKFKVHYDTVGQKLFFGNTYDNFVFKFNEKIDYDISCNAIINSNYSPNIWDQYTNWGLPAYLGFNKQKNNNIDDPTYTTTAITTPYVFQYSNTEWLIPLDTTAYYISAPFTTNILGENTIYMELDKYNSIDELTPYSQRTNDTYFNDYNGRVNSAFAKIPIGRGSTERIFDTKNKLQNVSQYHPPIDKIRKLKFTFRYHDGRFVDFNKSNFNFTIAFNELRDEIARDYIIRVPSEYDF